MTEPTSAPPPGPPGWNASELPPHQRAGRRPSDSGVVIGALLVVVGVLFLIGNFVQVDVGALAWPFFVIAPGVALLVLAASLRGASGLAVPGGIVTMTGIVLFVQNATGLWASWAYAWALVAPGGVGLGLITQGLVNGNGRLVAAGGRVLAFGVGIFVIGFVFFEGALHISGEDFGVAGRVALPAVLVGLGVWLLIRNSVGSRRRTESGPLAAPTPPAEQSGTE